MTESDELVGKFSFGSRLPQYLVNYKLLIQSCQFAESLALDHSDVDRRSRTGSMD